MAVDGEWRLNDCFHALLSVIETARELGISRSLVYELLASGALRSAKIGRRRLIPREAVEEFIAGLAPQARPA